MDKQQIKEYLESNKIINENGCFLLKDRKNDTYQYYQNIGVHRLSAWIWLDYDFNENLNVLHKCDNPPCWNPDHLYKGTQSENRRDSIRKGRTAGPWGMAALQAAQKHCKRGHEFTPENTRVSKGKRACKTCAKEREKRFKKIRFNGNRIRVYR